MERGDYITRYSVAAYSDVVTRDGSEIRTGFKDNSMGVAVAEIDSNLHICSCNDEFLRLVEMPKEEVTGSPCRKVFHCTASSDSCPVLEAITSGKPRDAVDEHPCNHLPMPYMFTFYPLVDAEGDIKKVLVAIVDFSDVIGRLKSELIRSYYRLLNTNRRLRDLEGVASDILAIVSHELKTPLTISMGCIDLALEEEDAGKRKELMLMAKRNLQRQNRIIDGMLELSKIRRGVMTLVFKRRDILPLVQQAVKEKLPFALQNGVRVEMELRELPEVEVDPSYLTYALEQIIDNAIKFNRRGGWVRVNTSARDGVVEIAVEDTGIGISEENMERIFEPFYQEDSSPSRKYPGIGLGLTLARKIIEIHRGSIRIEKGQKEGCRFSVILPVDRRR